MEPAQTLNGNLFADMLRAGAFNLRTHKQAINNLNVFPIPDGDTGDNMLLTIMGGIDMISGDTSSLAEVSRRAADGMLLSARGNSGVILSQLFDGIAEGFESADETLDDDRKLGEAMRCGVQHAYSAVMEPTEGTILTVARCASEYAAGRATGDLEAYLDDLLDEAKRTLDRTPDMLPVLKKAGVVDSGGAGLIYILEGMRKAVKGEIDPEADKPAAEKLTQDINLDLFTEDSILEYGYCTELLLRLQKSKTDPAAFEVSTITDYLRRIGDSVVAFKTGSIVKIHVHTMTPDKVLGFCQMYGEFLKIKIENMSLQHNNTALDGIKVSVREEKECKQFGIVAVCAGKGIRQLFTDRGADVIVEGGQSMNPSTEDFLNAFRQVSAKTILVLPNNANVILSAKQAASLYTGADVRVLESKTIGEGYAALSMFDSNAESTDQLVQELNEAMLGVVTAEVSRCVRDAEMQDTQIHTGDYIGFVGKELLAKADTRLGALCATVDKLNVPAYDICLLIRGMEADQQEAREAETYIHSRYPGKEVYVIDGLQEIYDYILILE